MDTHPKSARPQRLTDPLLDVAAAATRLGTPERFVRRLIAQRRVRYYKVGKYVRFDPSDLDEWLTNHRVEPWVPRRSVRS